VVDRHFVLLFIPSEKSGQKFELKWEINTYASISSEIADASLCDNVFVITTKIGRVFYNWNDKLSEFNIKGPRNTNVSNGVSAAEVSFKDGRSSNIHAFETVMLPDYDLS
jgi:hypothetical protein